MTDNTCQTIIEYLAERDVWVRPKTAFEKQPCYLCQLFDPWMNITDDGNYGYKYEQHPCWERRNYCRTFDKLCKKYREAEKTFWASERWRIQNKPEYKHMNANMFRNYDSSHTTEELDNE